MKTIGMVFLALFMSSSAFASGYGLTFTDMQAWVTFAALLNDSGNPITSFKSTWIVPPAPAKDSSQIAYYWNGLETMEHSAVLQPVLQWGRTPAGGGSDWEVGCWYVTSDGAAQVTPLVKVQPGDVLTGVITLTSASSGSFSYHCEFEGKPETKLDVRIQTELVLAAEVLEAYGLNDCSDFPGSMNFTHIEIQGGAPSQAFSWHPYNNSKVVNCGQNVNIVDNSTTVGEVDINTHP